MTEDTLTNHPDGKKTLTRTLEINGEIYRQSITGRWADDKGVVSLLDEWEADLPKRLPSAEHASGMTAEHASGMTGETK